MERPNSKDALRDFLEALVNKINKQCPGTFELNETSGYFAIQVAGKKKFKNVVCFVKNEPVLSINAYTNVMESLFEKSPYNKLIRRSFPPPSLQLRHESWPLYPHHVEYDLKKDQDLIFQLCKKACENFGH